MKYRMALINGRCLRYKVRRHPRARHRKVTVSRDQGVVVTLPPRDTLGGVDELLQKWADWLEEKIDGEGVWNGPVVRQVANGSSVLFAGQPCTLEISVLPSSLKRNRVSLDGGVIKMELASEEVLNPLPALQKFLKKEAGLVFRDRVDHWSLITGLIPSRVIVGERTSRWGSCSSRGTLSFCYRLIMAPPTVLDAIVIHELCHLRHPNHGKGFWALVKSYDPDYDQTRKWLKENAEKIQF